MKQLPSSNRSGFFEIRPYHLKMLLVGFLIIGVLFGYLLVQLIHEVSTDPYSFPFGNTKENPWIYTSPAVFLWVCIPCLLFDVGGTILIIMGQIKENKKRSLIGVGLIAIGMAVSLATEMVK